MKYQRKLEKEMMCPIEFGMDMFGGKWKARIMCVLSQNPGIRYNALRKELSNITDAVLTSMLKDMLNDELVIREQFNEIPPRVEYTLSEKGESVLPILQSICQWSRKQAKDDLDKKLSPCRTCSQLP